MKKKRVKYVLLMLILTVILLIFPIAIEQIIININKNPFNIRTVLPNDAWFGFIASYLGAIGTVILGIIAIWQNKRYKELSDKSSDEVMHIQKELKELNQKNVKAIETLERIEVAIYNPNIHNMQFGFYGINKIELDERNMAQIYQNNCLHISPAEAEEPLSKLMDKYNTYGFTICNKSEKTIRDFRCAKIKMNGISANVLFAHPVDIQSGENAYILFTNLPLELGETCLELDFIFYNLIQDKYILHVDVHISYGSKGFSDILTFGHPCKQVEDF